MFDDPVNCQHSGVDDSKYIIHLSKNLVSKESCKLQICAKNKIRYFCSDSSMGRLSQDSALLYITDCMLPHRWLWPTVAHNIMCDAIISLVSATRIQCWQRHAFQSEGIHQDIPKLYSCNQCCQVVTQHGDVSDERTNQCQLVR